MKKRRKTFKSVDEIMEFYKKNDSFESIISILGDTKEEREKAFRDTIELIFKAQQEDKI